MRRSSRMSLLLLWAATTAGVLGSCDGLFRPATPQAPSGGSIVTVPVNYTTPDDALETLALGLAAKGHGNGLDAYLGALADESLGESAFTATFDPEVASRYQQTGRQVPDWDLALERNFYRFFIELRSEIYLMRWSVNAVRGDDIIGDGERTLFRKYQVFVVGEDGTTQGTIAIGTADLQFKELTAGRWVVTSWKDDVDPDVGVDPDDPAHASFSKRRLDTQ